MIRVSRITLERVVGTRGGTRRPIEYFLTLIVVLTSCLQKILIEAMTGLHQRDFSGSQDIRSGCAHAREVPQLSLTRSLRARMGQCAVPGDRLRFLLAPLVDVARARA